MSTYEDLYLKAMQSVTFFTTLLDSTNSINLPYRGQIYLIPLIIFLTELFKGKRTLANNWWPNDSLLAVREDTQKKNLTINVNVSLKA